MRVVVRKLSMGIELANTGADRIVAPQRLTGDQTAVGFVDVLEDLAALVADDAKKSPACPSAWEPSGH